MRERVYWYSPATSTLFREEKQADVLESIREWASDRTLLCCWGLMADGSVAVEWLTLLSLLAHICVGSHTVVWGGGRVNLLLLSVWSSHQGLVTPNSWLWRTVSGIRQTCHLERTKMSWLLLRWKLSLFLLRLATWPRLYRQKGQTCQRQSANQHHAPLLGVRLKGVTHSYQPLTSVHYGWETK